MQQKVTHERILAGRYALYGPIATGGMATVAFGRLIASAGFSRTVAIKRIRKDIDRPELVASMLDEARLASRIVHPNVVATLDVVYADDTVFLVMEYVVGEAVSKLLGQLRRRGERVDPKVAAAVMVGVLHGLQAAHDATDDLGEPLHIVHRDVSPQNVLVGTDGLARLLDFGIARGKGRRRTTRAGQLKGKVAYMAPEQILGEEADRRTDVYAAAVVLWEILAGRRLFPGKREGADHDQIPRILQADIVPPSTYAPLCPRRLDGIVMRGLNRDPAARHPTAEAFAIELEEAIGLASHRQVGAFVSRVAAEALAVRARELGAIERASRELDPSASPRPDRPRPADPGPDDDATPRSSRTPHSSPVSSSLGAAGGVSTGPAGEPTDPPSERAERTTEPSPSYEGELQSAETRSAPIRVEDAVSEPPPAGDDEEPPSSDPTDRRARRSERDLEAVPSHSEPGGRARRSARSHRGAADEEPPSRTSRDRWSEELALPIRASRVWVVVVVVAGLVLSLLLLMLRR